MKFGDGAQMLADRLASEYKVQRTAKQVLAFLLFRVEEFREEPFESEDARNEELGKVIENLIVGVRDFQAFATDIAHSTEVAQ